MKHLVPTSHIRCSNSASARLAEALLSRSTSLELLVSSWVTPEGRSVAIHVHQENEFCCRLFSRSSLLAQTTYSRQSLLDENPDWESAVSPSPTIGPPQDAKPARSGELLSLGEGLLYGLTRVINTDGTLYIGAHLLSKNQQKNWGHRKSVTLFSLTYFDHQQLLVESYYVR